MATQTEESSFSTSLQSLHLEQEIAQLQTMQQSRIIENGQLKVSNQHLSAENAQLKERYYVISSQNQELSQKNAELRNENEKLKADITLKGDRDGILRMDRDKLQQHVKTVKFGAGVIEGDDNKTAFYTGLSWYLVFSTLFNLLYRPTSHSRGCKMTPMDELFIVLVRLHTTDTVIVSLVSI